MVCFGALFKILMTGTQASVQNQDVCTELIRAVGEDDISGNHTQISRLYKCEAQLERKKAQKELFKGFIRMLRKQDSMVKEFDEGLWSGLVQEVVIHASNDIRFLFKNGFEVRESK